MGFDEGEELGLGASGDVAEDPGHFLPEEDGEVGGGEEVEEVGRLPGEEELVDSLVGQADVADGAQGGQGEGTVLGEVLDQLLQGQRDCVTCTRPRRTTSSMQLGCGLTVT